ncbi:MAG: MCE family protein [Desulfobacteraceae bacterium]|nr:MCE family protein [Desulfobacteraceae bacterium]MBC2753743.1 MCE family protein [Desulfobacteraceae bacterium]
MAGRRRIRRINEGDFLQVIVSKNATLRLWPAKGKGSATIVDLVRDFHVESEAENSSLTRKIKALRYGLSLETNPRRRNRCGATPIERIAFYGDEGDKMQPRVHTFLKLALLWAIISASLIGCTDSTHDFEIRFSDVHGLHKGNSVYFEGAVIGEVQKVAYTDSGVFLVSVSIQNEFASAATDAARFFIDSDPENNTQKVIRVVQLGKEGNPIEEDAVIDGQTKYAVLYEQFAYQLGQNLTIFEAGINEFLSELQGFSTDEQIEELEKQLDAIMADMGRMTREMKHTLETEILPLLRQKIEELRKRLEGTAQEEDLGPIDQKMDAINQELRV